jgi:hypothetical protein
MSTPSVVGLYNVPQPRASCAFGASCGHSLRGPVHAKNSKASTRRSQSSEGVHRGPWSVPCPLWSSPCPPCPQSQSVPVSVDWRFHLLRRHRRPFTFPFHFHSSLGAAAPSVAPSILIRVHPWDPWLENPSSHPGVAGEAGSATPPYISAAIGGYSPAFSPRVTAACASSARRGSRGRGGSPARCRGRRSRRGARARSR